MPAFVHRIVVIEKAVDVQAQQIRTDGVEAAVDIIAAGSGRIRRVVCHRGQDLGHGRIFLIAKGFILLRLIQHRSIFQRVVDAVEQDVGDIDGCNRRCIDQNNNQQATEEIAHDLTHRLPYGSGNICDLASHLHDAEGKRHNNGNKSHRPKSIGNGIVAEKDVQQEIRIAFIENLSGACKHIEERFNKRDKIQQSLQHPIQQDKHPVKEHFLKP